MGTAGWGNKNNNNKGGNVKRRNARGPWRHWGCGTCRGKLKGGKSRKKSVFQKKNLGQTNPLGFGGREGYTPTMKKKPKDGERTEKANPGNAIQGISLPSVKKKPVRAYRPQKTMAAGGRFLRCSGGTKLWTWKIHV